MAVACLLHTSELLSHEVQESMGTVWCRNHSRSHELLSSVALPDEFTWCNKDGVKLLYRKSQPAHFHSTVDLAGHTVLCPPSLTTSVQGEMLPRFVSGTFWATWPQHQRRTAVAVKDEQGEDTGRC